MALNRLSEKLIDFGFTKEEAEVYVFLSSMGPSPARVVSRRFDVNRMRAYRTLKSLEEKGLVERIIGRPMRFVANPLQESLRRYIDGFREKLTELETRENEIIEDWTRISDSTSDRAEESRFRIFEGRQQIYELLVQMCERASGEICIVTTKRDLHRLALMGIDERLREISGQGIRVRVLTQVEGPDYVEMEYFNDFADIRHVPLPAPVRFVTIDERETLTTTSMEDTMSLTTQDDAGLWTNAPSYNSAMKVFFDALWRLATKASVIIEALQTGVTPQEIRVIRTDQDFQETFLEMIRKSGASVHMMASKVHDLPFTIEEIKGSLREGAEAKILTHLDMDGLHDIGEFFQEAEVKHSLSPFDLQLLIVDEKEALMNIPSLQSMDRAVWSNLDPYVNTLLRVFDDYWARGELADEIISRLASQREYLENLNEIKATMDLNGWQVESPGILVGQSGVEHTFNLVASNPENPERVLAIDVLLEETAFNHIIRLGARNMDLKPRTLMLVSRRGFGKQEEELASLYGIKLVSNESAEKLAQDLVALSP
jgi:sugar-specific transcriptional regulator TrmB